MRDLELTIASPFSVLPPRCALSQESRGVGGRWEGAILQLLTWHASILEWDSTVGRRAAVSSCYPSWDMACKRPQPPLLHRPLRASLCSLQQMTVSLKSESASGTNGVTSVSLSQCSKQRSPWALKLIAYVPIWWSSVDRMFINFFLLVFDLTPSLGILAFLVTSGVDELR